MNAPALVNTPKSDLVDDLAGFAAGIDFARLDPTVVQAVNTNVLDTLACGLAGSSAPAIAEVTGLVREWGGAPQASMFVFGGSFRPSCGVGGRSVIAVIARHTTPLFCVRACRRSAAIAAGQLPTAANADLITAITAGSIHLSPRPRDQARPHRGGFIYTSLFGYFGAPAAAETLA